MTYRRAIQRGSFFSKMSLTNIIIIINIVLYLAFLIIIAIRPDAINYIAIQPENIIHGIALWTIITSVFAHVFFLHLFVNMFSLFFLGNLTERIIGRKRFLWFYLIAGIAGSLAYVIFAYLAFVLGDGIIIKRVLGDLAIPALGASGALFGLLGILAVIIPRQRVYLVIGPLIILILQVIIEKIIPAQAISTFDFIMTALLFITVIAMFSPNTKIRRFSFPIGMPLWLTPIVAILPLLIISLFVSLPIGNTAHFGGLMIGLIYGFYLRNKYRKKVNALNRVFH